MCKQDIESNVEYKTDLERINFAKRFSRRELMETEIIKQKDAFKENSEFGIFIKGHRHLIFTSHPI